MARDDLFSVGGPRADNEHDPIDGRDDLYSALAVHGGAWYIGDPVANAMLPISREQIAAALAWRRRVAEREQSREHLG